MKNEITEDELSRLRKLEKHVCLMFEVADSNNLFIGMGRQGNLSDADQEGFLTKELRKLIKK